MTFIVVNLKDNAAVTATYENICYWSKDKTKVSIIENYNKVAIIETKNCYLTNDLVTVIEVNDSVAVI